MSHAARFLAEIEAFLDASGMSATRFGREAVGDPRLVFDLREKGERPGRNPKTGEEIPITARRVVTFRPGQKLKARVEGYGGPGTDG